MVKVSLTENTDPKRTGSMPAALGFPMCRATVEYEGEGYNAMLGWIQNVGEASPSDRELEFALDPFILFDGLPTPYAFFGARPELFDAPCRSDRGLSLNWLAHSFLCVNPSSPFAKEAEAVIGFSWGFRMDDGEIAFVDPQPLDRSDWSTQIELLSASYPDWRFTDQAEW